MYSEEQFRRGLKELQGSLSPIWPDGRNPASIRGDGPHYTLGHYDRPVSVGNIEAETLKNVARLLPVRCAFEVGTGFGYSSFWLAAGMAETGWETPWLGSLDNQTEGGMGNEGYQFATGSARLLGIDGIVEYFKGHSPSAIPHCLNDRQVDLAFIDGNHNDEQPTLDYAAIKPFLNDDGILLWHDIEPRYSVAMAVMAAMSDGWSLITLPTSCRLGASYKTARAFHVIIEAFTTAANTISRQPQNVI